MRLRESGDVRHETWMLAILHAFVFTIFMTDFSVFGLQLFICVIANGIVLSLICLQLRTPVAEKRYPQAWALFSLLSFIGITVIESLPDRSTRMDHAFPVLPVMPPSGDSQEHQS